MSDRAHDPSDTPEAAPVGLDDQMTTLRNQIDELDKQIVKLLNDRAECALDLGRLKEQAGLDQGLLVGKMNSMDSKRTPNDIGPHRIKSRSGVMV